MLSSSDRFLFARNTYQASQQHLLPPISLDAELVVAKILVAMPRHVQGLEASDYFVASSGHAGLKTLRLQTFGVECGRNQVIVV